MLKKLFGFRKKEKKEKKEEEDKNEDYEEKISEIPEPDTSKVELISKLISNTFEDNKDKFENQLSLIKEDEIPNIIQKIKIYFGNETKELDSIIISKNSLLFDISWNDGLTPKKIDILGLNKSYLIKTNSTEEGFIYIIINKILFISFFSNLFEKYIGIDKSKSNQEESFIINEKKVFIRRDSIDYNSDVKLPIYYIENNLIYLNGFFNGKENLFFNENDKNSILKAIYFFSLLINEKYKDFSTLNLSYANCGSLGIEILIKTNFYNLKVLKLSRSKMTSNSILLLKDNIFSNLTELDLSNNGIGNVLIENIGKLNLLNLTKLNLSKTMISNSGLKFFSSKNFEQLIELDLSYNERINDNGMKYLKDSKLSKLKSLNLEYIKLYNDGFNFIIKLPFSNSIESLALYLSNKIKYEDIPKISHNLESNLRNLKNLTYIREGLENLRLKFLLVGETSSNKEVYFSIDDSRRYANHLTTIGIDFTSKIVLSELKIKVKVNFWVGTGHERFRTMSKTYFKGAHGCILNFYMGDKYSFEVIKYNIKTLFEHKIPFVLLAKKDGHEIDDKTIQSLIKKYEGKIFYYDENNKEGIDEAIGYLAEKNIK